MQMNPHYSNGNDHLSKCRRYCQAVVTPDNQTISKHLRFNIPFYVKSGSGSSMGDRFNTLHRPSDKIDN